MAWRAVILSLVLLGLTTSRVAAIESDVIALKEGLRLTSTSICSTSSIFHFPLRRRNLDSTDSLVLDDNLKKWIDLRDHYRSHGAFISDKVAPKSFEGFGLGLEATEQLSTGAFLFKFPRKLLLDSEFILSSFPDLVDLRHDLIEMKSTTLIAVYLSFMMKEGRKGDGKRGASLHEPYVKYLPEECFNGLSFSKDGLRLLPLRTRWQIRQMQKYAKKVWEHVHDFDEFSAASSGDGKAYLNISKESFYKGLCYEQSRSFMFGADDTRSFMTPLVDWMNHSPYSNVLYYFDKDLDTFEVLSKRPLKKGDQLFINYGAYSNSHLLAHYGFVLEVEKNVYEEIPLPFPLPSRGDLDFYMKIYLLRRLKSKAWKALPLRQFGFDSLDMGLLRVLKLKTAEFSAWNVTRALSIGSGDPSTWISKENEMEMAMELSNACMNAIEELKGLPTVQQGASDHEFELSLAFRRGHATLLLGCLRGLGYEV